MTRVVLALALAAASVGAFAPAWAQDARRPSGIHYVYLIRHGMYDRDDSVANVDLVTGLNKLGHEQSTLTGKRLATLPVKLRSLVTSHYLRAVETADDIGAVLGMKPVVDTLIHECTPRYEVRPEYRQTDSEEEQAACEANLNAAFARYLVPTPEADTHDALVCHGNVTRWLVCKAMGIDLLRWQRMTIANASLTILAVYPDGQIRLAAYSDTGHIPVEKQTWTGRGAGWGPRPAARPAR